MCPALIVLHRFREPPKLPHLILQHILEQINRQRLTFRSHRYLKLESLSLVSDHFAPIIRFDRSLRLIDRRRSQRFKILEIVEKTA